MKALRYHDVMPVMVFSLPLTPARQQPVACRPKCGNLAIQMKRKYLLQTCRRKKCGVFRHEARSPPPQFGGRRRQFIALR